MRAVGGRVLSDETVEPTECRGGAACLEEACDNLGNSLSLVTLLSIAYSKRVSAPTYSLQWKHNSIMRFQRKRLAVRMDSETSSVDLLNGTRASALSNGGAALSKDLLCILQVTDVGIHADEVGKDDGGRFDVGVAL